MVNGKREKSVNRELQNKGVLRPHCLSSSLLAVYRSPIMAAGRYPLVGYRSLFTDHREPNPYAIRNQGAFIVIPDWPVRLETALG